METARGILQLPAVKITYRQTQASYVDQGTRNAEHKEVGNILGPFFAILLPGSEFCRIWQKRFSIEAITDASA